MSKFVHANITCSADCLPSYHMYACKTGTSGLTIPSDHTNMHGQSFHIQNSRPSFETVILKACSCSCLIWIPTHVIFFPESCCRVIYTGEQVGLGWVFMVKSGLCLALIKRKGGCHRYQVCHRNHRHQMYIDHFLTVGAVKSAVDYFGNHW